MSWVAETPRVTNGAHSAGVTIRPKCGDGVTLGVFASQDALHKDVPMASRDPEVAAPNGICHGLLGIPGLPNVATSSKRDYSILPRTAKGL